MTQDAEKIARDTLDRYHRFMRLNASARQIVDAMSTPGIDYRQTPKARVADCYAMNKYDCSTGNWRSGVDEAQYQILLAKFGERKP